MAFAVPSLVTGALVATGLSIAPLQTGALVSSGLKISALQTGAYSYTGLKSPSLVVGELSSTGLRIPSLLTGIQAWNRDVRIPSLVMGDFRDELNRSIASMGSIAEVLASYSASTTSNTTATANPLVSWNPVANASSLASMNGLAEGGTFMFVAASSAGAFTSTGSAPTIFWEVVGSSATIAGNISALRVTEATVTASVMVNGVVLGQASYQVSAASLAEIVSGIQFVQDFWDGWAFNLNTAAPSAYENFKFNSFARIGSDYYGCNEQGIYLLGGDLDGAANINATMTTGTSDLSTENFNGETIKTIPAAYVAARSVAPLKLTCRVEGQEYSYTFNAAKDAVAPSRVDIGRGLFGTFWQFELANQNGADFEIDSLTVSPHATKRKV